MYAIFYQENGVSRRHLPYSSYTDDERLEVGKFVSVNSIKAAMSKFAHKNISKSAMRYWGIAYTEELQKLKKEHGATFNPAIHHVSFLPISKVCCLHIIPLSSKGPLLCMHAYSDRKVIFY